MHIEFLVEELSAKAALENLVPKILGTGVTFDIHPYEGKKDLLGKLYFRLKGYKTMIPTDWRIVVLVDQDQDDCRDLKAEMENAAEDAGLITRSASGGDKRNFQVLNRIAIEELEAWFFGDVEALVTAYPGVPPTLNRKSKFCVPDAIRGGTWENLEKVLRKAGHYKGGLPKIKVAREISALMSPERNTSHSFQVFQKGLLELAGYENG